MVTSQDFIHRLDKFQTHLLDKHFYMKDLPKIRTKQTVTRFSNYTEFRFYFKNEIRPKKTSSVAQITFLSKTNRLCTVRLKANQRCFALMFPRCQDFSFSVIPNRVICINSSKIHSFETRVKVGKSKLNLVISFPTKAGVKRNKGHSSLQS